MIDPYAELTPEQFEKFLLGVERGIAAAERGEFIEEEEMESRFRTLLRNA